MATRRAKRRARRRSISRNIDRQLARRGGRTGGSIPIRTASISGLKGAALRALGKSSIGKKFLTVARQQISRIPGIGRLAGRTRAARRTTAKGLARREASLQRQRLSRGVPARVAKRVAAVAVTGAVFEAGSTVFSAIGGEDVVRKITQRRGRGFPSQRARGIPFTPGTVVPPDSITHTWIANGVPFAQLADGRVMVQRKNGTIKTFRRPRPIVLGRNPGVRDLVRADKKIDSLLKLVRKRFPAARRNAPRSAPAAITQVRSG